MTFLDKSHTFFIQWYQFHGHTIFLSLSKNQPFLQKSEKNQPYLVRKFYIWVESDFSTQNSYIFYPLMPILWPNSVMLYIFWNSVSFAKIHKNQPYLVRNFQKSVQNDISRQKSYIFYPMMPIWWLEHDSFDFFKN